MWGRPITDTFIITDHSSCMTVRRHCDTNLSITPILNNPRVQRNRRNSDHMICLIIVYFNTQIMGCGCFYFTERSAEKTDCQMLNNEWHINYLDLSRFLSRYLILCHQYNSIPVRLYLIQSCGFGNRFKPALTFILPTARRWLSSAKSLYIFWNN